MKFTPREFQSEAINSIFSYFRSGNKGNPLVVAPTGSGKSVIIACFCEEVIKRWPKQKILIISHIKEILGQNYKALKKQNISTQIGLYSAGLNSKSIKQITIAGIQSVYNKPELFDQFNIIIVDECHTIPLTKDGMYPKFFKQVKKPVIGFTATPFRLGTGYLHLGENSFFDDIVYTIPIKKLQREGYLCKITAKGTKKKLKADGIKKQAGDYIISELSLAFDREAITKDIISELVEYKDIRKKWLLFAIDINHAEHITQELINRGVTAAFVHSKMKGDRTEVIRDFKNNKYQALVSVAVLTTGYDEPNIDLIGLLRPTESPVLHVQIIGRGLRPVYAEGYDLTTMTGRLLAMKNGPKENCLVLDFACNLLRNGPIDDPTIKLKGDGSGEAIMKECDNCFEIVHAAVKICPACGEKFKFKHKLQSNSKDGEILSLENWHNIDEIKYFRYIGSKEIPMLKVSYFCGIRRFSEYVCFEHSGYAKYKAEFWWRRRTDQEVPETAQEALEKSHLLLEPKRLLVNEDGKYDTIKKLEF